MPKRDVALTVLTRFFVMVLAFMSSVETARFLGPEGRGDYFVAVTFAAMAMQLGNLGLQFANTYYVTRNRVLLGALLANSLSISIFTGGGYSLCR